MSIVSSRWILYTPWNLSSQPCHLRSRMNNRDLIGQRLFFSVLNHAYHFAERKKLRSGIPRIRNGLIDNVVYLRSKYKLLNPDQEKHPFAIKRSMTITRTRFPQNITPHKLLTYEKER